MRRAFVGVASQNELVTLLPEQGDVVTFLCRRAERADGVCFWAVVDSAIAATIVAELEEGDSRNALILLQTLAVELGPIFAPNESNESHDNQDDLILTRIA